VPLVRDADSGSCAYPAAAPLNVHPLRADITGT
jgi:hypothetical protein